MGTEKTAEAESASVQVQELVTLNIDGTGPFLEKVQVLIFVLGNTKYFCLCAPLVCSFRLSPVTLSGNEQKAL